LTSQPDEPTFASADDDLGSYRLADERLLPDGADLPNPLGAFDPPEDQPPEDMAADELAHLDAALEHAGFRERLAKETERVGLVMSTNFWFAICFGTDEQAKAFLDAMDWTRHGERYLDGRVLAAQQGIDLPDDPDWPTIRPVGTLAQRAHTVEGNRALDHTTSPRKEETT